MKNYFPSEPVKDNGANTRHDDHNQPEKFPERRKIFPTCKNWEGVKFFLESTGVLSFWTI